MQKKIYKCDHSIFREPYSGVFKPYSGVFKPYSDVLKPYNDVFLQFMELESLKLEFHVDFFSTSDPSAYKSRLKNSSFILELEF